VKRLPSCAPDRESEPIEVPAERKQLTVLCARIRGSSKLGSRAALERDPVLAAMIDNPPLRRHDQPGAGRW
jgi:hypothetical protein